MIKCTVSRASDYSRDLSDIDVNDRYNLEIVTISKGISMGILTFSNKDKMYEFIDEYAPIIISHASQYWSELNTDYDLLIYDSYIE